MVRIDRIVLGGLGLGLVLAILNGLRGVEARAIDSGTNNATATRRTEPAQVANAESAPPAPRNDVKQQMSEFLTGLDRFRHGDDSILPALRTAGDQLGREHGRKDAAEFLAYYASLAVNERAAGLAEESRFVALWDEVGSAGAQNLSPDDWRNVRDRIQDQLQALASRVRGQPDYVPAARALSLSALLEIEQLERDPDLQPADRDELFSAAEMNARESIELFSRAGMLTPQLEPRWILGRLEAASEASSKAESTFKECLAIARLVQNEEYQVHGLTSLMNLAVQAGDPEQVSRILKEMSGISTAKASWPLARGQALLLLDRDEGELTATFLRQHRSEHEKDMSAADLTEWHLLLGGAFMRSGKVDAARAELATANRTRTGNDLLLAQASLDVQGGNPDAAMTRIRELGQLSNLPRLTEMRAHAIEGEAQMRLGRYKAAIAPLAEALEIASERQSRLELERSNHVEATSVLGANFGLQVVELLAEAHARCGEALEAARAIESYQSSTLRFASVRTPSARSSLQATRDATRITTDHLVAWAKSFEFGLLTWVVGRDSSVVAFVAPDGSSWAAPISQGRQAVEDAVRRVREAAMAHDTTLLPRLWQEVRSTLLPNEIVLRMLSATGSRRGRVLLLLHGPIERLPIELLEMDGDEIGQRCIPVVLPGLPAHEPGSPWDAHSNETWTLLGSPIEPNGSTALPGAAAEIRSVASLHNGASVKVGSAFDRAALVNALGGSGPVHIATHLKPALDAENGRLAEVGLEFSNAEVLSAADISRLTPQLPLVVLDACETAEGRGDVAELIGGEGMQGVARAFLESGTRNLLVTLWPVEDEAAQSFAIEFHGALVKSKTPSEAAASARRVLRARGMQPADWAAYRFIGRD